MINEIETAFNNLLNDAIKKGIIGIEELKGLIIKPSPTHKLLHVFTPVHSNNPQYLQSPIGSINISKWKNSMQSDLCIQQISKKYIESYLFTK